MVEKCALRGAWLFAVAILVSAFLVFQVQPIISKIILPWFGGSPAVWTTCMLFFQVALFGGYAYAHALNRLRPIWQASIHLTLIVAALLLLPISPAESWKNAAAGSPTLTILRLLAASVGLPYFLLSSTGPLLQAWFSRTNSGSSPYRLYALSNVGSLAALLTYPFLVEPNMTTRSQSAIWSAGFGVFALCCAFCAWIAWRTNTSEEQAGDNKDTAEASSEASPSYGLAATWLVLTAFASAMLLATTNHVCQDIAVIPFLWVVPLSLYLLTFIICFDKEAWYVPRAFATGVLVTSAAICLIRLFVADPNLWLEVTLYFAMMFFVCMLCHGELVRRKPAAKYLTWFYLMSSAGGAIGGVFVAVVCPVVFSGFYEMNLGILVGYAMAAWIALAGLFQQRELPSAKRLSAGALVFVGLLAVVRVQVAELSSPRLDARRNFYGTLHLEAEATDDPLRQGLYMYHGRIAHGFQFAQPSKRRQPTLYFDIASGAGVALNRFPRNSTVRVGVIGLGAGTLAAYAKPGDYYRFYEINPAVCELADKRFTFLSDCLGRVEVILGDARVSMESEPPQQFDILVLDAFSGDAIPMHLLTREAFQIYRRHLKPGGVVAANISNRYVDLVPVFDRLAEHFGYDTRRFVTEVDVQQFRAPSHWFVLTNNQDFLQDPVVQAAAVDQPQQYARIPLWTDHYNNLFQVWK